MKARLIATVALFVLTASTFCSAQPDTRFGGGAPEIHSLGHMLGSAHHLQTMLDHLLNPGGSKGFNPQPDPPRFALLLPAVQKLLNFTDEMAGDGSVRDPRLVELRGLLEELQALLRLADAGGLNDELEARMAVDMFRILQLIKEIQKASGPGIG